MQSSLVACGESPPCAQGQAGRTDGYGVPPATA